MTNLKNLGYIFQDLQTIVSDVAPLSRDAVPAICCTATKKLVVFFIRYNSY